MKAVIQEITKAVEALMVLTKQFERGQCVSWEAIEAIAGPRDEGRGRYVITKWRRRLFQEREIVTLCADGIGVRLLTHKETAREIPRIRQRKAYRQVRRAIKECETVDQTKLSDHDWRLLSAQRMNMAEQRQDLYRSQKQLAAGAIATECNPRRKV